MRTGTLIALGLALVLAAVHVFARRLRPSGGVPRSAWLSGAGGASVAYVFLHLLPELAAGQDDISAVLPLAFLETHVWLVALLGLATFYGLDQLALTSSRRAGADEPEQGVFWVHVGSFAVYNTLVGYLLLHREESTRASLLLFGLAMALHFFVNDDALRQHYADRYHRVGRWLLSGAVLVGWGLGAATAMGDAAIAAILAFVGGGVILNVLKEELPSERESRFWAFALGAALYAGLLLAVRAV